MVAYDRRYQITIYALIVILLTLVITKILPDALSVHNLGFQGVYRNGHLEIDQIEQGSPAHKAGIEPGDEVVSIDGRSIDNWYHLYRNQLSEYHNIRSSWLERPALFIFRHQGKATSVEIQAEPLSVWAAIHFYMVHMVVVGSLLAMIVFITISNPRDTRAFLVALNFLTMAFWILVDLPGWPGFMQSLVPAYSIETFILRDAFFILSLQVLFSISIHILLVFPCRWLPDRVLKLLLPVVYAVPTGVLLVFALFLTPRPIVDNLTTLAEYRLQFDTILLIIVCGLIVTSYRLQKSPIEKEQARWILRAMLTVGVVHLGIWNIPKILFGEPLVLDYAWMQLLLILIPLSFTVTIANHHLFGIQGLARRRLSILESLLSRERSRVQRRDGVIQDLTSEIEYLKEELQGYEATEQPLSRQLDVFDELLQLEDEYPEIRRIRQTGLLGKSPAWIKVFRETVLAAHGNDSVVIVGESGTGKTDVAKTVYRISDRNNQTYRQISCAQFEHADPAFALSKLFGVGSNHGLPNFPKEGQPGLLEECDGGVLFLDDFDRLPLNVQDLLLYPLEGKPFEPGIGTGKTREVSVKFILATNRNPELLVSRGLLQGDVLARMGARINIPPLRDRPEDIPVLVEHFLGRLSTEFDHVVESVSPKAMKMLKSFTYHNGNARELYAELRQAVGKASLEKDHVLHACYLSETVNKALQSKSIEHLKGDHKEDDQYHSISEGGKTVSSEVAIPRELSVLRRHNFLMQPSEEELGLSHKSKTLSNHLRGLCIKALAENDWQPDRAAKALAPDNGYKVIHKLERKIDRYLKSIKERVSDGTYRRLYTNLPASYHEELERTIRWARK